MLKSVRNNGFGVCEFSVDWLQPLAAPTIIVACGPRRMSDAMSTTYDTDMFEPLAIGNWTLKADVNDERTTSSSSGGIGQRDSGCRASMNTNVAAPRPIIATMYRRARGGKSRSKTPQV